VTRGGYEDHDGLTYGKKKPNGISGYVIVYPTTEEQLRALFEVTIEMRMYLRKEGQCIIAKVNDCDLDEVNQVLEENEIRHVSNADVCKSQAQWN
jgi:hypothetical protein